MEGEDDGVRAENARLRSVLEWLANGQTGMSSEAMAFTAVGVERESYPTWPPSDPADFNRCMLMLERLPFVRDHFGAIASLSPEWRGVIKNWDDIERSFLAEVGRNWSRGKRAQRTYSVIKSALANTEAE